MLDIEKNDPFTFGAGFQRFVGTIPIADTLEEEEVTAGREIIREGEIGDRLYVVVKGDYEVLKGGQVVASLGERSVFGEMALLDPEVRSATVQATQEGLLLSLDHCTLEELMEGDVDWAHAFLKVLCGRPRDANRKLAAQTKSRLDSNQSIEH
jgi:CRP/FNR family cyclic AMP-dependent transcriptional regulator